MTMKLIAKRKLAIRLALFVIPVCFITAYAHTSVRLARGSLSTNSPRYSVWSTPINLGSIINSVSSEQHPAISKNGLSLYFTSTRAGGVGRFDIYVSQRESKHDPWGSPVNLGPILNTTFDEGNVALSRDEHLMFFQSDRPGGLGLVDIWVSRRCSKHDDFGWQPAVNLGAGVNSAAGDNAPSYFENEDEDTPQLYFASNRPGGLGGLDIYVSDQTPDGSFGPAVLVTELSSPGGDSRPSIRHDGLEIFLQSDRSGTAGAADLWVSKRESTANTWSTPENLGNTINTVFFEQNPYLSFNGKTLFFASDRSGGSGGLDLYMTTRTKLRGGHHRDRNDDNDDEDN
jgi:Tol biopolymer transport system component